MNLSVVLPTHNPDQGRLKRTLLGLCDQSLPSADWETVLVNNASTSFPTGDFFAGCAPRNFTVVAEPELGLSAARRRGLSAARGSLIVLVDDDNVLAPDYLAEVTALFAKHHRVGAAGGRSRPEFAATPPAWTAEFHPLLALRDLGDEAIIAASLRPSGSNRNEYPLCAPIGAGMALRRAACATWMQVAAGALSDRRGSSLTSGGDNEIVLQVLQAGWAVAYFPSLTLTHLIPADRLEPDYLARLNRGIQKSWIQVLTLHEANPWPPLTPAGACLRKYKAWFTHRAWTSPAARIRWQGACGHYDGLASLADN